MTIHMTQGTVIHTARAMTMDNAALYRLMTWLSPGYPVGAFAYSQGMEQAFEQGIVTDTASMQNWLKSTLTNGPGRTDAALFVCAHRAAAARDGDELSETAELGRALAPSRERKLETCAQGQAFMTVTRAAWAGEDIEALAETLGAEPPYPVAVGAVSSLAGIDEEPALTAFLQALVANLVSAGVRLIPLGQTDGQRVQSALADIVFTAAAEALAADLDDIGSIGIIADIYSMRHETQYTRLFRS